MANKKISQLPIGVLSGNTIFPIVSAGITSQTDLTTIGGFINDNFISGTSTTFSGGTVTGPTYFTNGATANTISVETISATTYLNLPITTASTYVLGWQGEKEIGNSVTIGKGVGKLLLTNGSTSITGVDGVDFDNQSNFDSPFYYFEATIILADGTRRYIALDSNSSSTEGEILEIYSDNRYVNALGPAWAEATGEYEYFPYFIPEATGEISYAIGYRAQATSYDSYAIGDGTTAGGNSSHAEGKDTIAFNTASHAEGNTTTASGASAHAEGQNSVAGGAQSHAEGLNTRATGGQTHAEGNNTRATGSTAHAEGNTTFAGFASHAEGQGTTAHNGSHAEGQQTQALGQNTHAEGEGTRAIGLATHAEGKNTRAETAYSHAEGSETSAKTFGSHSEGNQTIASGTASHSEGYLSRAMGEASHAEGINTLAAGLYSHAEGLVTQAIGENSHAEGNSTIANGNSSHVEGIGTTTNEEASHAEGATTTANGYASHAEGFGSTTGINAVGGHAEGYNATANGEASHAEGKDTTANGIASHVEGGSTFASGVAAHAEGTGTTATGIASHAEGKSTSAQGTNSHAEGFNSLASGDFSHAEGQSNQAIGISSHVEGDTSYAIGEASHAEGNTRANGDFSHSEGLGAQSDGEASHAEGRQTLAGGRWSHAEGRETIASGITSHAGGSGSTTLGSFGFVHGLASVAGTGSSIIVLGSNITGTTSGTTYVDRLNIKTLPSTGGLLGLAINSSGQVVTNGAAVLLTSVLSALTFNAATGVLTAYDTSGSTRDFDGFRFTGGTVTGSTYFSNGLSANTFSAATYLGLPTDSHISAFTFNSNTYDISIFLNDGTAFTQNLSVLASSVTITGGTYNPMTGVITFVNNTGGTFNVSGFASGFTDTFTTAATLNGTTIQFADNIHGLNYYSVNLLPVLSSKTDTALFNSHTANTNNPHQTSFANLISTGHTHSISDIINLQNSLDQKFDKTGGTITGGITAYTISGATYLNLPLDRDTYVTGGTYSNGTATYTNNTGGTFSVTGFSTGTTDSYTTGGTLVGNIVEFGNNVYGPNFYNVDLTDLRFSGGSAHCITDFYMTNLHGCSPITVHDNLILLSGLTINNTISTDTISATTYLNLPIDIRVTGGSYSNATGVATFRNNTGGTFSVINFFTGSTDVYVTGGTYNNGTITITNNTGGTFNIIGLFTGSTDVYVTGGTYNNATGTATFTNNTGGTFNVTSFFTGSTEIFVTGGTYSNGTATFTNNTGGTFSVTGFSSSATFTGGTVNGATLFTAGLSANTISATTYLNLPSSTFTGGTITAPTQFTGGLTANTISATTITAVNYVGLPTDITITGGTHVLNTGVSTFTNNTGGTFNVSGYFNPSNDVFVTGGTYLNGTVVFTNRTGGTFNVTGFSTGGSSSVEVFVTGGTYSNGTTTYTNNTGGTFTVTGLTTPFTGGTITGPTLFTGGLSANTLSANTISANSINISGTTINKDGLQIKDMLMSSGAYVFSGITLGTGNTFNVALAKGFIIDTNDPLNVIPQFVSYSGASGLTTPFLTASSATYILLNSANTLTYLSTEPSLAQRRQNVYLGVIGHPNGSSTGVGNRPDVGISSMSQVRDMFQPMKLINDGVVCYANSTNMTLANTAGTLYGMGIGFVTHGQLRPSSIDISAGTPTTFQYRTQTGGTFANTTTISAATYDVSGVTTTIPGTGSTATNQRIYLVENGVIRIQFGQTLYSTLTEAIAGAESVVVAANNRNLATLIGILSITRDCTNLSDTTKARFLQVTKFGESVGSSANQMSGFLLASLTCSANVDQIITTSASTIAFDTDEVTAFGGISRSGNTFIISSSGLYQFSLQPQVLFNNNGTVLSAWAQKNGVNVPRSGIRATAGNAADSGVLPLITTLDLVNGDQIIFKATSSVLVGATLDFTASGATIPAIPAVILDIKGWRK